MANSSGEPVRAKGGWRRAEMAAIALAVGLFLIQTAWKALRAPWLVEDFPEALYIKVELLPWIFPAHMITGGLALLLVPAMILASSRPAWHRRLARVTVPVVVVAGLTAFPVALVAPVTAVSSWGFAAQGAVWLALLGLGIWHVRHGRIAQHRACMLLMAATTTGAVFFRIYLALFALYGHPRQYQQFYAIDAWIAWTLPLLAMAFFLKRTGAIAPLPR
ncbi:MULTISPECIES: DUF2306 domain-containing protein [unclassified Novosphingobium]|uniref:DUF2306 domain-containing protein n=1 Tax=unclassified Novosphingobium TaxID=2644732 RepID=UPI0025E895F8|nr:MULTISPECIES: DUF2306 domain-containing protein [unclassified Novosphingobium]HQV01948.1 DUF2306 domain-containing protein [Novosphingobium sp.]